MPMPEVLRFFPEELSLPVHPRPYVNHSVEFKHPISPDERLKILEDVGLNVFFFPAEYISGCDLLSDSGTTTMTNEQWAVLQLGDESYGSNRGYFELMDVIRKTFGESFADKKNQNAFIFHQGRPSEDALFSILGLQGPNQIIPSNGHFDTTFANIQANQITALNLFSDELRDNASSSHFKGNMNTTKLEELLKEHAADIPVIYLTITNNTGGGQPVSMENIQSVHALSREFGVPLFFDACRFAENAWFIKQFENGYKEKSIPEIVHKMFSYVDGFTVSFKKDGLVNMGGGLFLRRDGLFVKKNPAFPEKLMDYQIIKEGHPTYGGMSGRDIMALTTGLQTVIKEEYLNWRIKQVQEFGEKFKEAGIPVVMPIGGHAVYADMNAFFEDTTMRPEDFGGISFTALLLGLYGHRACELGNFAFGSFDPKTGKEKVPEVNFVRFAVPRLRYETEDLLSVVHAARALYNQKDHIPKVQVIYGRELPLRHFKARFTFV